MKRIFTLCCVFLTLVAAARAQDERGSDARNPQTATAPAPLDHGGKIESNYDGFEHETVVALKRMNVTCGGAKGSQRILKSLCVSLQAALHCPGKQLDYVRRATIRLTFEAKDWDSRHPADERELTAVADGETIRLGRMTLVSQGVADGWLAEDSKETLEAAVPYASFLKLARAAYVELSVGKTSFALRDKNVAALRDMSNRVKLPRVSGAAPPAGRRQLGAKDRLQRTGRAVTYDRMKGRGRRA